MKLIFTATAREKIRRMHPVIRQGIRACCDNLAENPYLGKALRNELEGYRALVYKRYRIIYKIEEKPRQIHVHTVGHREEIYESFTFHVKRKN